MTDVRDGQPKATRRTDLPGVWEEVRGELVRLAAALGAPRDSLDDILQDVYVSAMKGDAGRLSAAELKQLFDGFQRIAMNLGLDDVTEHLEIEK